MPGIRILVKCLVPTIVLLYFFREGSFHKCLYLFISVSSGTYPLSNKLQTLLDNDVWDLWACYLSSVGVFDTNVQSCSVAQTRLQECANRNSQWLPRFSINALIHYSIYLSHSKELSSHIKLILKQQLKVISCTLMGEKIGNLGGSFLGNNGIWRNLVHENIK